MFRAKNKQGTCPAYLKTNRQVFSCCFGLLTSSPPQLVSIGSSLQYTVYKIYNRDRKYKPLSFHLIMNGNAHFFLISNAISFSLLAR